MSINFDYIWAALPDYLFRNILNLKYNAPPLLSFLNICGIYIFSFLVCFERYRYKIRNVHDKQSKFCHARNETSKTDPEVIKLFSCSTQLSMKLFLLINVKMPAIVGILTFISGKNSILDLSEPKKSRISLYFYTYEHLKFHA